MWPPSKWSLTVLKLNTRSLWISEEGEISEVNLGVKAQDDSLWFLLKGSKKRLAYLGIAGLIREGGVVKIWQKCFSKGMNLSVCQNILWYTMEILIVVTVIVAKCRIFRWITASNCSSSSKCQSWIFPVGQPLPPRISKLSNCQKMVNAS